MYYQFLGVLYLLVIVFGAVGNILVVKWFGKKSIRKKAGNKMVVVLAVNDFVSSIIIPLLRISQIFQNIFQIDQGKTLCHLSGGVMEAFLIATSWLLVAISIDRLRLVLVIDYWEQEIQMKRF